MMDLRAASRLWMLALATGLAACPEASDPASPGGGPVEGAGSPSGQDGGSVSGDAASPPGSEPPTGSLDEPGSGEQRPLVIQAPVSVPIGRPWPIVVSAPHPVSDNVVVSVGEGGTQYPLRLYRGKGSVSVSVDAPGPLSILAEAPGWQGRLDVLAEQRPPREMAGTLRGSDLVWSADRDVVVSATVLVERGDTLTVGAGTRVFLASRARVEVLGTLRSEGQALEPVLFTVSGAEPWGELLLGTDARAELNETFLLGGGGDVTRAFGHSDSQPVVRVSAAALTMTGGGILDAPGKAFGSDGGIIDLTGVIVSRVDQGGEHKNAQVLLKASHFLEIPDGDGSFDDDDNDGIYLTGARLDVDGAELTHHIVDTVFAMGEDDGIDQNNANVLVERCWIEGFRHEGIAASNGRRIEIRDSVVRGCEQGIEAGYGRPEVHVEHCTVTGNVTGLRFGDSYDWGADGQMNVRYTISQGNIAQDVRNYRRSTMTPKPGGILMDCSLTDNPDLVEGMANSAAEPEGRWRDGCASGPVLEAAQCGATVAGARDLPGCP